MIPLVLIGGGGHCISCIDVIESSRQFSIEAILDDREKIGQKVLDYSIKGTDDDIPYWVEKGCSFLITVGQIKSYSIRKKITDRIKSADGKLATIISPNSYVSPFAIIGEGTIIMHHALVNAGVVIGKNCIINSKALIEHESTIGDFCHISTGAILNGQVHVDSGVFAGSQCVVNNNITISENVIIPSGSTVRKNIEVEGIYEG